MCECKITNLFPSADDYSIKLKRKREESRGLSCLNLRSLFIGSCPVCTRYARLQVVSRLQNSPYFCVFKYARAVKQKVWNEAENREREWGETLRACEARARKTLTPRFTVSLLILRKKPTVLQSKSCQVWNGYLR